MPEQDGGIILDTLTGLYCKTYSTTLSMCTWDVKNQAVEFPTLEQAQDAAANMDLQAQTDGRFIGQNPGPR